MKKIIIIFTVTFCTNFSFGQYKLSKDIDNDGKKDTVYVDPIKSTIVCILSTQNYKSVSSKPIDILNETSGISEKKMDLSFLMT